MTKFYLFVLQEGRKEWKEMFYLMTYSLHFIYGYMASVFVYYYYYCCYYYYRTVGAREAGWDGGGEGGGGKCLPHF